MSARRACAAARLAELRATACEPWALACVVLVALALLGAALGFRVNVTRSYPLGLYRVTGGAADAARGTVVVVCLPEEWSRFAQRRGYLGPGWCTGGDYGLGKMTVAAAGDVVELGPEGARVNGRLLPHSRPAARDAQGRPVPHAPFGRRQLAAWELWLYSPYHGGAFDSRYFGPARVEWVRAVVRPVLTWR
jgi:conjugative transfer signal peptidase TraF